MNLQILLKNGLKKKRFLLKRMFQHLRKKKRKKIPKIKLRLKVLKVISLLKLNQILNLLLLTNNSQNLKLSMKLKRETKRLLLNLLMILKIMLSHLLRGSNSRLKKRNCYQETT